MKKILISISFLLLALIVKPQDIHFSQYNEAPLMVNPALTGYFKGQHRIALNYKNQWRSLGGAYNTYAFTYDAPVTKMTRNKSGYLALGANFFKDIAGDLDFGNLNGKLNIAYHLKLNEYNMLAAGIYGGFGQYSLNSTNMQWGNQYDGIGGFDPSLPSNEYILSESFKYVDFGFGMNWGFNKNSKTMTSNDGVKANAGFAVHHVNKPEFKYFKDSESRLGMRISAHARAQIGIDNSNAAIVPQLLVQVQRKQSEFVPGLSGRFTLREESKYTGFINDAYISFGGFYRVGDAIIAQALLEISDISLGVSYDINVSKLSKATKGRGGFEVMLRYVFDKQSVYGSSMY
ncbi:MAG: PorP/SprF family type IX secretion system membrane protein [Bacteroidales bacterium]|nr:PorP/SprF family type IX secretion system membrane protein [Bacteroidales bacterium]